MSFKIKQKIRYGCSVLASVAGWLPCIAMDALAAPRAREEVVALWRVAAPGLACIWIESVCADAPERCRQTVYLATQLHPSAAAHRALSAPGSSFPNRMSGCLDAQTDAYRTVVNIVRANPLQGQLQVLTERLPSHDHCGQARTLPRRASLFAVNVNERTLALRTPKKIAARMAGEPRSRPPGFTS